MIKLKCIECGYEFLSYPSHRRKYCSWECYAKNSLFRNSDFQRRMSKRGMKKVHESCKRNKTGFWSSDLQRELGKRGARASMLKGVSIWAPGMRSKAGSIGIKVIREKAKDKPRFRGIVFDSKSELMVCKFLINRYMWKPLKDVTVHHTVGHKEFDFMVRRTFIDYHSVVVRFKNDVKKEDLNTYYKSRRKCLNENGFSEYNYIVVPTMKKLNELILTKEGVL